MKGLLQSTPHYELGDHEREGFSGHASDAWKARDQLENDKAMAQDQAQWWHTFRKPPSAKHYEPEKTLSAWSAAANVPSAVLSTRSRNDCFTGRSHDHYFQEGPTNKEVFSPNTRLGRSNTNGAVYNIITEPLSARGNPAIETKNTIAPRAVVVQEEIPSSKALLLRVEQLSNDLRRAQLRSTVAEGIVRRYEAVLGPLDQFAAQQVHLREEVVRLRDEVIQLRQNEEKCLNRIHELETSHAHHTNFTRGGEPRESGQRRIDLLQGRLTRAHMTRFDLLNQLEQLDNLTRVQTKINAPGNNNHHWSERGKRADLELRLRTQEDLIRSISTTIETQRDAIGAIPLAGVSLKAVGDGKHTQKNPLVVAPGAEQQIESLMLILESKNNHISELRKMLSTIIESGNLGVGYENSDHKNGEVLEQGDKSSPLRRLSSTIPSPSNANELLEKMARYQLDNDRLSHQNSTLLAARGTQPVKW